MTLPFEGEAFKGLWTTFETACQPHDHDTAPCIRSPSRFRDSGHTGWPIDRYTSWSPPAPSSRTAPTRYTVSLKRGTASTRWLSKPGSRSERHSSRRGQRQSTISILRTAMFGMAVVVTQAVCTATPTFSTAGLSKTLGCCLGTTACPYRGSSGGACS